MTRSMTVGHHRHLLIDDQHDGVDTALKFDSEDRAEQARRATRFGILQSNTQDAGNAKREEDSGCVTDLNVDTTISITVPAVVAKTRSIRKPRPSNLEEGSRFRSPFPRI